MKADLKVTKRDILWRGVRNRCPNCGAKTLFKRWFTMHVDCPRCGMTFERGEGFFLGAMTLNYTLTVVVYLLPILILTLAGVLPADWGIAVGLVGGLLFPLLIFRSCRSWWLMIYFYFLPQELPANRQDVSSHEDEA